MRRSENIIEVNGVKNFLGDRWVHEDLNFTVKKGEIVAIIGASGSGKTTLLRTILMLQKPSAGNIKVFGTDITHCSELEAARIRRRWGVTFQSSALFSSLTVLENVMFPLSEFHLHLDQQTQMELARLKVALVGLDEDAAVKYPAELSGGMEKRVAVARAISLDPELLFLDEPTAGLDPHSAEELDDLILYLRDHLNLTVLMATHDLDTLWRVPDRVIFLGEGKVLAAEPINELVKNKNEIIMEYFAGPRAQAHMKR